MKTVHFLFIAFFFASFQSCQNQSAIADKNIANIKAAYEALNQRNWDAFTALCDGENYVDVNVGPTPTKGVKNAIELYKQFFTGYPDFKLNITDIAPVGNNRYLLRTIITATNTGTFMGIPPTGKSIKFTDADVVVMNTEGKCISHEITNVGEPLRQIGYGSMMNPNTQIVMAGYDRLGKGDIPGILALCDDNVVFEIEEHQFDSKARMFNGKEEAGKFFEELGAKFKYTKFQPIRFVADGDDVFALIDTEYTDIPSGKNYAVTLFHQFKIVNGKVTYARGLDGFAKQL